MSKRRKAREVALQVLYAAELSSDDWVKALDDNVSRRGSSDEVVEYAKAILEKAVAERERLDGLIEKRLENWNIKRVSLVDLIIMRIALVELIFFESTPRSVIIDEAVEIAHRFSSKKAGDFVNGILDKLADELRKGGG